MKRVERRLQRLHKEGFPYWEAHKIAQALEYRLDDPVLRELRRERRAGWRASQRAGLGRRSYTRQIAFQYRVAGLVEKGRYQPMRRLTQIGEIPRVRQAVRMVLVQRETAAGYEGRYRILRGAGFFPWEARLMAQLKDVNPSMRRHTFLSKPWQLMIQHHRKYRERMLTKAAARVRKEMGPSRFNQLTRSQVVRLAQQKLNEMLRRLYAMGKYSPWDFLKLEYRPKPKPRDYTPSALKRAREKLTKVMSTKKQAVLFFD